MPVEKETPSKKERRKLGYEVLNTPNITIWDWLDTPNNDTRYDVIGWLKEEFGGEYKETKMSVVYDRCKNVLWKWKWIEEFDWANFYRSKFSGFEAGIDKEIEMHGYIKKACMAHEFIDHDENSVYLHNMVYVGSTVPGSISSIFEAAEGKARDTAFGKELRGVGLRLLDIHIGNPFKSLSKDDLRKIYLSWKNEKEQLSFLGSIFNIEEAIDRLSFKWYDIEDNVRQDCVCTDLNKLIIDSIKYSKSGHKIGLVRGDTIAIYKGNLEDGFTEDELLEEINKDKTLWYAMTRLARNLRKERP